MQPSPPDKMTTHNTTHHKNGAVAAADTPTENEASARRSHVSADRNPLCGKDDQPHQWLNHNKEAQQPQPPVPAVMPDSLRRLHNRIRHMRSHFQYPPNLLSHDTQTRPTKALDIALPAYRYEYYEVVCKKCKDGLTYSPAPSRARVSGVRADIFGDIFLIDHAEMHDLGARHISQIVLGAAPALLYAHAQSTQEVHAHLDNILTLLYCMECNSKAVVPYLAFRTDDFESCYTHHRILYIAIGARTPWPNRAEAAVRLHKIHTIS